MEIIVKQGVNVWLVWLIEPGRDAWHLLHSSESESEATNWANRLMQDISLQWSRYGALPLVS